MPIILPPTIEIVMTEPSKSQKMGLIQVICNFWDRTCVILIQASKSEAETYRDEIELLYHDIEELYQNLLKELEDAWKIPKLELDEVTRKQLWDLGKQWKMTEIIEELNRLSEFTKLSPQQRAFTILEMLLIAEDNKPMEDIDFLRRLRKAMEDILTTQ